LDSFLCVRLNYKLKFPFSKKGKDKQINYKMLCKILCKTKTCSVKKRSSMNKEHKFAFVNFH